MRSIVQVAAVIAAMILLCVLYCLAILFGDSEE